ncbi:(2Fe-2S)-binding protein [Ramlibacter monticola]|uniref:(2Fe-2S)-binding protein n=1 Tax=Ramlibacter monticola TaxID=1926872 RepID=A0A936YXB2_9BURK|nr:(2Fe-2S)-binding protein [Ramlibacter monticola]MBL0389801.1 (2Fe-2S)-binding protein [Ramlibacter monticola]
MSLTTEIRFTLNGVQQRAGVAAGMSALQMLREVIGLSGTKYGCGEGECGACTILVDGRAVNACLLFALDCEGRELTTIEGLAQDARARVLQDAFVAQGAVQCGFCTPGMVMQAASLLATNPQPDAEAARRAIEGNLCRCTGYQKIVDAIVDAGRTLAKGEAA